MIINGSADKYKKKPKKRKLRPIWYLIFILIIVGVIIYSFFSNQNIVKISDQKINMDEILKIELTSYINDNDHLYTFRTPQDFVEVNDYEIIITPDSTGTKIIEIDVFKDNEEINTSKFKVDVSENYYNIKYLYPTNKSVLDNDQIVLSWEINENYNDGYFNVYFGKTKNPKLITDNYDQNNFIVDNIVPGEEYFWKVEYIEDGKSFTEGVYSFKANSYPNIPEILEPENNSIIPPEVLTVLWKCEDKESEYLKYDIYFGTDGNLSLIKSDYAKEELNIVNIEENKNYTLQIEAIDENGAKTKGKIYNFKSTSYPEKVNLINPKLNDIVSPSNIFFNWDDKKENMSYTLIIDSENNISYKYDNIEKKDFYIDYLGYDSEYDWKIISDNKAGISVESDSSVFKTAKLSNLWEKYFGGQFQDVGISSASGNEGEIFLTGYFLTDQNEEDTFISKINNNGEVLNTLILEGNMMDLPIKILKNSSGNYILIGYSNSSSGNLPLNNGGFDSFIMEIDPKLNILWIKQIGGQRTDYIFDIEECNNGSYFFTGYTESSKGDISGEHEDGDLWYGLLDSNGNLLWQNYFGEGGNDCGYGVEVDDQYAYIVGYIDNEENKYFNARNNDSDIDVLILKINYLDNELIFSKKYGGTKSDYGVDIKEFNDELFILAGSSSRNEIFSGNNGNRDVSIIKINKDGEIINNTIFGGSNDETPYGFEIMPNGNLLISASSNSNDKDLIKESTANSLWVFQVFDDDIKWQDNYQANALNFSKNISYVDEGNYMICGYTFSYDVFYSLIGN